MSGAAGLFFVDDDGWRRRSAGSALSSGSSSGSLLFCELLCALLLGLFGAGEFNIRWGLRLVLAFGHGDVHGGREVLHQADLANPVLEGLAAKDGREELGWISEALLRLRTILAELVVCLAELCVGKDLVGFADFLKFFVGGGIIGILVCSGLVEGCDTAGRRRDGVASRTWCLSLAMYAHMHMVERRLYLDGAQ